MTSPCTAGVTGTQNVLGGFVAPPGTPPGPIVVNPDGSVGVGDFQPARVPVCLLRLGTSQSLTNAQTPSGSNTDNIIFDTTVFDTFSNAPGDGTIVDSLAGYYQLNAAMQLSGPLYDADPSGYNVYQMAIAVNGVGVAYDTKWYANGAGNIFADTLVASNIVALNPGDVVSVYVKQQGPQSPGGNVYIAGLSDMISYLSASYIGKL